MVKYRIEWISLHTGIKGHGDWYESKKFVEDLIEYSNKLYKEDEKHTIGICTEGWHGATL